jgi:hypothetical protein
MVISPNSVKKGKGWSERYGGKECKGAKRKEGEGGKERQTVLPKPNSWLSQDYKFTSD